MCTHFFIDGSDEVGGGEGRWWWGVCLMVVLVVGGSGCAAVAAVRRRQLRSGGYVSHCHPCGTRSGRVIQTGVFQEEAGPEY